MVVERAHRRLGRGLEAALRAGRGDRPRHVRAPAVLAHRGAHEDIGAEPLRHLTAQERAERDPGDPAHHLAHQIAEAHGVVPLRRARLPPRRRSGKGSAHLLPVVEVVRRHRLARRDQPRAVAEQPAHRDVRLALLCELRPVAGDRRVQVELAPVDQKMRAQRGHPLGRRVHVHQRIALPRARARVVWFLRVAAPQVDDEITVDRRGDGRPQLAALGEIALELLAYALESGGAGAMDAHGHDSPRSLCPADPRHPRAWLPLAPSVVTGVARSPATGRHLCLAHQRLDFSSHTGHRPFPRTCSP